MTRLHQNDPQSFPRDGSQAYHMSEVDYRRVIEDADQRGWRVTGVYHSHVEAGAYFSELDQEFVRQPLYPFPDAIHLVISVVGARIHEMGAFRYEPDEARFVGYPLEAGAP